MTQSKIIQQLCELVDDKQIVENEEYKKQREKTDKWYDQLDEYLKNDKKLFNIFFNFELEEGARESIVRDIYYREGFLCGARLALEICGLDMFDSKRG